MRPSPLLPLLLAGILAATAYAQPREGDTASHEAVVAAGYASLQRPPGESYDWERDLALFIPQGLMISAIGDGFSLWTPNVFSRFVDSYTDPDDPDDPGFAEWETHQTVHRYGDVAVVFSTYEKAFWDREEILGRGVNSHHLVRQPDGAWRLVSIVWDEETDDDPLPARYGGIGPDTPLRPSPGPTDYATPLSVVDALYATVQRAPGDHFDWERMRSLFLPQAVLIPNTEQRGGELSIETPGAFIALVDQFTTVGGEGDRGFAEEEIHAVVEQFGDVAHVFSTYEKRYYDSDEILGRGINSVQLVRHDGRWWIVGMAWDEEDGAGPIPAQYLPN